MQDDRLFAVLTPRELFQFSANLRLPRSTTKAHKELMINEVIRKLKMDSCADTQVGSPLQRGLSGGERKRTAIGYELVTNPSLLFLDEPTTGLDSSTAYSLLITLKELASEGHTILCTIHQPSSDIFRLFDKLTLLVQGSVAFTGVAQESMGHFEALGHPCPVDSNPTDFFMSLLQTQSEKEKAQAKTLVEAAKRILPLLADSESAGADDALEPMTPPERPPFYVQFWELTKRNWVATIRNPITFKARLGQYIFMALLTGCVYYQLDFSQAGIHNREGALFFLVIGQVMTPLNAILLTFPLERLLLAREQSNGMYGVTSYYLGKFFSSMPIEIFFSFLISAISYWMIGLNNQEPYRFFMFLLALELTSFAGGSLGLMLGCIFPNPEMAVSLAPIVVVPFMLFGGFYININSIPVWLRWLQYLSLYKWGFQALATNEFHDTTYHCNPSEYVSDTLPNGETVTACPITNGNDVLTGMGYSYPDDYWIAVGVIAAIFVGLRIIAFIGLHLQTRKAMRKDQ